MDLPAADAHPTIKKTLIASPVTIFGGAPLRLVWSFEGRPHVAQPRAKTIGDSTCYRKSTTRSVTLCILKIFDFFFQKFVLRYT